MQDVGKPPRRAHRDIDEDHNDQNEPTLPQHSPRDSNSQHSSVIPAGHAEGPQKQDHAVDIQESQAPERESL